MYLEPETSTLNWLFQLDDSKSLHEKWLFHQTSIKKNGSLEFQVYIYIHVFFGKNGSFIPPDLSTIISPHFFAECPWPRYFRRYNPRALGKKLRSSKEEKKTETNENEMLHGNGILIGGFNPSEKYARQIGNLPQFSG